MSRFSSDSMQYTSYLVSIGSRHPAPLNILSQSLAVKSLSGVHIYYRFRCSIREQHLPEQGLWLRIAPEAELSIIESIMLVFCSYKLCALYVLYVEVVGTVKRDLIILYR